MTEEMSDPLAFQGDMAQDANISLDFDLDPTITSVDPTVQDPTVIGAKSRTPRVKLTSERLMSKKGLPYVMEHGRKSCRISKNKSSYENLTGFLQFYQLWAHDLYPKAKFKDFISLCETIGKSDRDLREYRANLVRKDMGMLIEDFERGEGLDLSGAQSPGQPQGGLFVTEASLDDRVGPRVGVASGSEADDDDLVYSSYRQRTAEGNTRTKSIVEPQDEEMEELIAQGLDIPQRMQVDGAVSDY